MSLSASSETSTPPDEEIVLDVWHSAIVESVMASDRARVEGGEVTFIRGAVEHEFCLGTGRCVSWPTMVVVHSLRPDMRIRRPLGTDGAAA